MSLKNARVLVIGGTSGIGLGVASAAGDRGAIPIVVSRSSRVDDVVRARHSPTTAFKTAAADLCPGPALQVSESELTGYAWVDDVRLVRSRHSL